MDYVSHKKKLLDQAEVNNEQHTQNNYSKFETSDVFLMAKSTGLNIITAL